jgi:hypothetical protein
MPLSLSSSTALSVAVLVFFATYSYCFTQFGVLFSYCFGWMPSWAAAYMASSLTYSLCSNIRLNVAGKRG